MHPCKRLRNSPLSKYSDYSACFPPYHLTSQEEGKTWAPWGQNFLPSLSCFGLAGTGAGTWATASAHGTGPPLLPHVCTPAWPTFSLAVGSKASSTPLGISVTGMSAWLLSLHLLLLLAAAGSGASHLWTLGSMALDKGSPGPIPAPPTAGRAKAPRWIFKFRGQPPGRIDK